MRSVIRSVISLVIAALLIGGAYYYKDTLAVEASRLWSSLPGMEKPCQQPILYSIGAIDPRFGLTKTQVLNDVAQAAKIWDATINKDLFEYSPEGPLKINLIYDSREQATQQLDKLGITISDDKATYDALKAKYTSLSASYDQAQAQLQASIDTFQTQKTAYETQVSYWNDHGGAPPKQYAALQQMKDNLNAQALVLQQDNDQLNQQADTINALVGTLNGMANSLNLTVSTFNTIGAPKEFEEGEYIQTATSTTIDIYQFQDQDKLLRVLAHELGHSLGLQHVSDPKAIMYYLNEGVNEKATAADIAELKQVCGIAQ